MTSYLDWKSFLNEEEKQPRIDSVVEEVIQREIAKGVGCQAGSPLVVEDPEGADRGGLE
ncbi:hypothetical protein Pmar_PMAR025998 [Perkinsus marinus ATCC 50983]|uniref:Uncharacterized protein n=1 Tax=Perkinsus marinus (strain ATCC 50983 / TXsc) TaxID=423536 RepID=C5LK53_PERM5|nr:hypothetical protein Pmar_PMAR025998 [Perkinsus marinus ATCC 50983]EER02840.1 hypothetical protein Pmar_PMAR025998 [Perkinsus marinus ATCC 50983]|eukprot:XP_002771024.1 hypothetical protein Pmar_PMAR025998 [Perkinsus marinus ATCC 50983]